MKQPTTKGDLRMTNKEIIETINNKILESLEKGVCPWKKDWSMGNNSAFPINKATNDYYRGINVWLLMIAAESLFGGLNVWCGIGQGNKKGWRVRKGEKATNIYLWTFFEVDGEDKEGNAVKIKRWYMKPLNVFNISQFDGVPTEELKTHNPIQEAETLVSSYKTREAIQINIINSSRAFYSITGDSITVPEMGQFSKPENFYSVLLHEIAHSTGAETRLNREFGLAFGNDEYAFEELVAELTSAYLCGIHGIQSDFENHAAYIASWSKRLKANPEWFFKAASLAQKAADFAINGKRGREDKEE
jgi:antirestriction protein ArdC